MGVRSALGGSAGVLLAFGVTTGGRMKTALFAMASFLAAALLAVAAFATSAHAADSVLALDEASVFAN
jgi:hypothetical protein